jgi:monolysocardiolipin acyltransferase
LQALTYSTLIDRLCCAGEWLHFFPEGGVWQLETLGGRKEKEPQLGKLKWGIGKLIAHAKQPPIVIPFHISGTEHIVPQNNDTKAVLTKFPIPGHNVHVVFGESICFDDIIAQHESEFGPIRKFDNGELGEDDNNSNNCRTMWGSEEHEYRLYHRITARVEESMEALAARSKLL